MTAMDVCRLLVTIFLLGESMYVHSFIDDDKPLTNNIFPEIHRIPSSNIFPGIDTSPAVSSSDEHGPFKNLPLFNNRYRPRKRDLKLKKLLKKLGDEFDPFWMSIESPLKASSEFDLLTLSNAPDNNIDVKLKEDFDHINFTFTNYNGLVVDVGEDNVELFKRWLLVHGSCQVRYEWEDQGALFWPRWIKRGSCSNAVSCSWPIGMHCVPKESKIVQLLRWNCRMRRAKSKSRRKIMNQIMGGVMRKRKSRRKRMRCRWIKVPFPVTDECFCSC